MNPATSKHSSMDQLTQKSWHNSNPFATKYIKPGAIPFLFDQDELLDSVLSKFEQHKCVGQIVGPHGSGKSTLVCTMEDYGWMFDNVRRVTIRGPKDVKAIGELEGELSQTLMVVDGLERLSWLHRWLLVRFLKLKAAGLLVTTHKIIRGLPVIFQTTPSYESFRRLVAQLQPEDLLDEAIISACYQHHAPDVREALMELYDCWEELKKAKLLKPSGLP